jgi:hypothetical protein
VTEAEIEVPSGSQEISVSVITREGTWSQTTRHDLPTGGREILDVRIRNGRSMEMEMKWKR